MQTANVNRMMNNLQSTMSRLEDKYLSLFKFNDMGFKFDINQGVSMPLPDVFKV